VCFNKVAAFRASSIPQERRNVILSKRLCDRRLAVKIWSCILPGGIAVIAFASPTPKFYLL